MISRIRTIQSTKRIITSEVVSQDSNTFVGFGFGAIQAGLFVFEAQRSGRFDRLVVADVVPELVAALRAAGGYYGLNIARNNRVESLTVGPIEIYNPEVAADRDALVAAISRATELATALPSVRLYKTDSEGSVHRLLQAGFSQALTERRVVYTAENDIAAAEKLRATLQSIGAGLDESTCVVNTVIGKMSGVVDGLLMHDGHALAPITPATQRAFLVEEFRCILISKVEFSRGAATSHDTMTRGIDSFEEKPSLLPFEEAKLYGHNATHALAGYLAAARGLERMDELQRIPGCVDFLRAAFTEESGASLIQKWSGVDPLFTPEGFGSYVDDLLVRMLNPHLGDRVERITRDPRRKLGWNDRLVGLLRLALEHGISPQRYALGAAAEVYQVEPAVLEAPEHVHDVLNSTWAAEAPEAPGGDEQKQVIDVVGAGTAALRTWLRDGTLPIR